MATTFIFDKTNVTFVGPKVSYQRYQDVRHSLTLNGEETFEFVIPYADFKDTSIEDFVMYNGLKFVIKDVTEVRDQSGRYVRVYCENLSALLLDFIVDPETEGDTWLTGVDMRTALERAIKNTPFTLGNVDDFGTWDIEMHDRNSLEVINEIRENWMGAAGSGALPAPPTPPSGLQQVTVAQTPESATLSWVKPEDVSEVKVYRNEKYLGKSAINIFSDTTLQPATSYTYKLTTLNTAGVENTNATIVPLTTGVVNDVTPPSNVGALTETHTASSVTINWVSPLDADLKWFEVYRNNVFITTTVSNTYTDNTVVHSTQYTYRVVSVDQTGNKSLGITIVATTSNPSDTTPPAEVTNLSKTVTHNAVTLTWTKPSTSDFSHSKVYRNGVFVANVTNAIYTDGGRTSNTTYSYKVTTVDTSNNESIGVTISATTNATIDTTPPAEVTSLNRTTTGSSVSLTWVNPTTSDFSYVKIYRNGVYLRNVSNTAFLDSGLLQSTTYTYKLTTVDTSGNESVGATITATTTASSDVTPPANITSLTETHTDVSATFNWVKPTDSDFSHVKIYKNGVFLTTSSGTSYVASGLTPSTSYNFKLASVDTTGNESVGVSVGFVTNASADVTPPAEVSSLVGSSDDKSYIKLTWVNPTDADFAFVRIYRNGSLISNSNTGTSYIDNNVVYDTPYTYVVKTVDISNNESSGVTYSKTIASPVNPIPDAVTNLSYASTHNSITVSWVFTPHPYATGIYVYDNDVLSGWVTTDKTSYTVTNLRPATTHNIKVIVMTNAGTSDPSYILTTTKFAPDTIAPFAPGAYIVETKGQTLIHRLSSTSDTDVAKYEIYRGGSLIGTINKNSILDTTYYEETNVPVLTGGAYHEYSYYAIDASNNKSAVSKRSSYNVATTPVGAATPPSVTNLKETHTDREVKLSWSKITISGDPTFFGFLIYRDGELIGISERNDTTSFTDSFVKDNTTYNYQVRTFFYDLKSTPTSISATTLKSPDVRETEVIDFAYVNASRLSSNTGNWYIDADPVDQTIALSAPNVVYDGAGSDVFSATMTIEAPTSGKMYVTYRPSMNTSSSSTFNLLLNGTSVITHVRTMEEHYINSGFFQLVSGTNTLEFRFTQSDSLQGIGNAVYIQSITVLHDAIPEKVVGLAESHTHEYVKLTWANPQIADFKEAEVFRDGVSLGKTTSGIWYDSNRRANTTYVYKVCAIDENNNSDTGTVLSITMNPLPVGTETIPWDLKDSLYRLSNTGTKKLQAGGNISDPWIISGSVITSPALWNDQMTWIDYDIETINGGSINFVFNLIPGILKVFVNDMVTPVYTRSTSTNGYVTSPSITLINGVNKVRFQVERANNNLASVKIDTLNIIRN